MRTLMMILTLFTFLGCSSDEGEEQYNFDIGFEFSVKDSEGNDLLNPENPNSFNQSKIKLFYLINGNSIEVYDRNKDYPRNFLIYKKENVYRIKIFVNHSETEEIPTTYIQWNEADTDTLSSEIFRTNSLVKIEKVWLNEELIWTLSNSTEPYYEIIK